MLIRKWGRGVRNIVTTLEIEEDNKKPFCYSAAELGGLLSVAVALSFKIA
jgi:hypothetical protein